MAEDDNDSGFGNFNFFSAIGGLFGGGSSDDAASNNFSGDTFDTTTLDAQISKNVTRAVERAAGRAISSALTSALRTQPRRAPRARISRGTGRSDHYGLSLTRLQSTTGLARMLKRAQRNM